MKLGLYLTIGIAISLLFSCNSSQKAQKEADLAINRQPERIVAQGDIQVGFYQYDAFKAFLEAENDTTYIVNFWATWCGPCVKELPHFEALYQKYKDQKVRLILVSLDFEKQLETKLLPFLAKEKLTGEVLVLSQKKMNETIDKIDASWTGSLPATIIYNKKRRAFFEQSFDFEELETELKMIL